MKKSFIVIIVAIAFIASGMSYAFAGSCDSCPSKAACGDAKAGGECPSSAPTKTPEVKNDAKAETKATDAKAAEIKADGATATAHAGVANFIIKVKGDKVILGKVSAGFAEKFQLKDNKGADCELTTVAGQLWIKIKNGAEKDKLDYLAAIGIPVEKK